MKKLLSFITIIILSTGGNGFASETSADEVLLVTRREQVEGCKFLGQVTGSSTLGGIAAQKWGKANAEKEMRNKTARMGGNVIHVHSSRGGFYGAEAVGDTYLCSAKDAESAAEKTPPAEAPAGGQGGCTKDTDCKGDRVCESGKCVNP